MEINIEMFINTCVIECFMELLRNSMTSLRSSLVLKQQQGRDYNIYH